MSRQRRPVGKECWRPAELIRAWKKEENVDGEGKEGGERKMVTEGLGFFWVGGGWK